MAGMRAEVEQHRDELIAAAERHRARNVRLFGSVATGRDDDRSDVDFLVDFEPGATLLDLADLRDEFQEILGEAAKQISDEARSRHPGVPWRDLARVRDVYTNAYHRVDYELMWEQLVTQLPELRRTLGRIDPDDVDGG